MERDVDIGVAFADRFERDLDFGLRRQDRPDTVGQHLGLLDRRARYHFDPDLTVVAVDRRLELLRDDCEHQNRQQQRGDPGRDR